MNATLKDLEITFRPPFYGLAFWFVSAAAMLLLGLFVVGHVFEAPVWVRSFSIGIPILALVDGLVLSFSFVRVSREGLASRHHARWSVSWEQVEVWSQGGPKGSVYLRTRDGQVRGFSSWCVYGARCDQIASVLKQRVGPAATGDAMVAPEFPVWLSRLLGR